MSNMSQEEIDKMLGGGADGGAPAKPAEAPGENVGRSEELLFSIGAQITEAAGEALQASFKAPVSATVAHAGLETLAAVVAEYQSTMLLMEGTYTSGLAGGALLMLKEQDTPALAGLIEAAGGTGGQEDAGGVLAAALQNLFSAQDMVLSGMTGSAVETATGELVPFSPESPGMLRWVGEPEPMAVLHIDIAVEGAMQFRIVELMHRETLRSLEAVLVPEADEEDAIGAQDTSPADAEKEAGKVSDKNAAENAREPEHRTSKTMGEIRSMKTREHKPVQQSPSFDKRSESSGQGAPDNIGLIIDMPLQVTVELGNVRMSIKEILAFNLGSIIELDRMAEDLVDVKVNGKLIARGEIVVVDENYGVRITDILSPERRVNSF